MQKIQIQQPSGETRNATYTITTIIRGNTKSNKYKYKQSPGEIQLLAFHQVIARKTKFYSFVYTHLNVYVEIKFTGYETNISSFLQARECFKTRQYMWRWHQSQGLLFHLHTALPFCVTLYCVPSQPCFFTQLYNSLLWVCGELRVIAVTHIYLVFSMHFREGTGSAHNCHAKKKKLFHF